MYIQLKLFQSFLQEILRKNLKKKSENLSIFRPCKINAKRFFTNVPQKNSEPRIIIKSK